MSGIADALFRGITIDRFANMLTVLNFWINIHLQAVSSAET